MQFAAYKQFCDDTTASKQKAIKEANEWVETAKSSDEPTSHDLPRLEFVSEARAASDSKQLGVGHAARLASLPQPSFRLARCAKDPRGREPGPRWPPARWQWVAAEAEG